MGVQGENAVQVGQRLLSKNKGLSGIHRAPFDELLHEHGLGEAKAAQIKAAVELGRRLMLEDPEERPTINSPTDAAELVRYEMSALEQEHLRVLLEKCSKARCDGAQQPSSLSAIIPVVTQPPALMMWR